MGVSVITAAVTGSLAVLGSYIGNVAITQKKSRQDEIKMAKHEQRQQDALEMLKDELASVKKRLDQHNGYAEKFAEASKDIALIKKDVEYLKSK